jgi:hypothetical protein
MTLPYEEYKNIANFDKIEKLENNAKSSKSIVEVLFSFLILEQLFSRDRKQ